MSSAKDSSGALDPSFIQEFVSSTIIAQYWQFAIVALLVYDSVITMDRENQNRYTGIFGAILSIFFTEWNMSPEICKFSVWSTNVSSGYINNQATLYTDKPPRLDHYIVD
ncbi:uncharacterized protein FOMMEDRAFT_31203 [Fomitiporia mediterranea MF3/22]|uniref:uncharacterized protein n=1 Tax=Fomitiporia mediterranea (strain MF3/22) TaxID=694068 RepID=UPI0004407B77|nr:uncharacterized protein FOMMEDRAFT_31203 [Fomitiporia mediterranea MF3/22]EJC99534.1 hypothetical protein FOMMEDRAFT_31203 [Fomitiporia mediterranea MF3/22]